MGFFNLGFSNNKNCHGINTLVNMAHHGELHYGFFGLTALGPSSTFKQGQKLSVGVTLFSDEEWMQSFAQFDSDKSGNLDVGLQFFLFTTILSFFTLLLCFSVKKVWLSVHPLSMSSDQCCSSILSLSSTSLLPIYPSSRIILYIRAPPSFTAILPLLCSSPNSTHHQFSVSKCYCALLTDFLPLLTNFTSFI